MSSKGEAFDKFKAYTNIEGNNTSSKLKRFHSDNAREYLTSEFDEFCIEEGILHTTSAPYSPEQNGSSERINRTLLNKVRALLIQSNLAKKYWGEAITAAVYLYNRTPHSAIDYKTPYELKYGKKPDLKNIKIWGSLAYKREPTELISKLDSRAKPYYLVGYGSNQYKLLNPETSKIIWARDLKILEGYFYKRKAELKESDLLLENSNRPDDYNIDLDLDLESNPESNLESNLDQDLESDIDQLSDKPMPDIESDIEENSPLKFYKQLLDSAYANATSNIEFKDPTSYKEAISNKNSQEWLKAMEIELKDLEAQNTWSLVTKPKDRKILKGKWVYKTKLNPDNSINKYKARWVIKGFLQKPGLDYFETFANTVKPIGFRLLFAIAAYLDWEIHQWDIKSAFPNAEIDSEIYMEQPIGYNKDTSLVCKLNKALYGLKQAARQWQIHLSNKLDKLGFIAITADNSIFINKNRNIILATHIDDILVFSDKLEYINSLYKDLSQELEVSNLGEIKYYLGIEVLRDRSNRSITLTQRNFILNLLNRFNKLDLKPTKNPLVLGVKLEKNLEQATELDIKEYQKQIGSLIYLVTATRPDLAYPVGLLARFMSNPNSMHFKALNRIWQYLVYSKDYGLKYQFPSKSIDLLGYCDSDWGGDYSRKSTTGYVYLLGNQEIKTAISWNSKLQKTIALSSCEAEYMADRKSVV